MPSAPHPAFSGWRVCAAAVLTQAVAVGFTLGSVSVFAAPLAADLGATATQFNLGVAIFSLTMNLSMPLIGRQLDRGRIRGVMTSGAVLLAAALAAMSRAGELWQVGLCFGVACAVGMAMLGPISSSTAMANWFSKLRGRALGIANMGAPAGPVVIAPAAAWAIAQFGWRTTLLAFAAATLVVGVPCVRLGMLDRPSDVGQFPDGEAPADVPGDRTASEVASNAAGTSPDASAWTSGALVRAREFWLLALGIGALTATGIVMGANAVPIMARLGASGESASFVVVAQSFGAMVGPVLFGTLADRFHPRLLFLVLLAVFCAGLFGLVAEPSYAVALALFVAIGVVGGSMMAVYGALIGRLFGVSAFGQVMGLSALVGLPALFAMPLVFGATFDATGHFARGLLIQVATLVVAFVCFALLPQGEARRAA